MIAQKLTLRISPPKLPGPGTAPVAAINLKFSENMPRFVQNRSDEEWTKSILRNEDLLRLGIKICIGRIVFVCLCVQGLSLIAPDRRSRSGPDKHHSMRQIAVTTMALVTWRHVPRGTCHVPPREPLQKQHELDTFFEGTVAETWNLQGRCTLVLRMCHVSDDPDGSKLCPQGTIPFFNIMPSSSDTLWRNFTKFGTGGQFNKCFQKLQNLGGSKN